MVEGVIMHDADTLLDWTWRKAVMAVLETGCHCPMFFVYRTSGLTIFDVHEEMESEDGKRIVSQMLHSLALENSTMAIVQVSEAWSCTLKPGENPRALSESDDRVDSLVVSVETRKQRRLRIAEIVRDGGLDVGDYRDLSPPQAGLMCGFFPMGQA